MNKIVELLRQAGTFYLATADEAGDPRVRPFGAAAEFEGKAYLCTNNQKPCFAQMLVHPRVEISGMIGEDRWIRLSADAVRDDRRQARAAMLEQNPGLRAMYGEDDGLFEVLALQNAVCTVCSFTAEPETVTG